MTSVRFSTTQKLQWQVSDPSVSAWVRANAGSGKTHVLTQRVLRLLLSGTDPASILCLTFTKAAAAEMSRRIFGRLAEWAVMPEEALGRELIELQGFPADARTARMARTLFARALDTPGGLKIQTMHAFCEGLLHLFPFEANVPGHFDVLDDQGTEMLLAEARSGFLAGLGPVGTPERDALNRLLSDRAEQTLQTALRDVINKRAIIEAWIARSAPDGEPGSPGDALDSLRESFALEPGETAGSIAQGFGSDRDFSLVCEHVSTLLAACDAHPGDWNAGTARVLRSIVDAADPAARADAMALFYLTNGRRKKSARLTKPVKECVDGFDALFDAEAELFVQLYDRFNIARMVDETGDLLTVGMAIVDAYKALKDQRGYLDYDDLISRARGLLSGSAAAAWVLYKLDSRIDHILVDEAQDTSAAQWSIIEALAGDFFAGRSAGKDDRTIFAVGDDKQSIYSFQGAAPQMLADMERRFRNQVTRADKLFASRPLALSFRSTHHVLHSVDTVFRNGLEDKVTSIGYETHSAYRGNEPGRIVVWPRVVAQKRIQPDDWTKPWDAPTEVDQQLARSIAAEIARLLHVEKKLPSGKPVRPGEILILVRKRDAFFTAMNRALAEAGIATAGADRVQVSDHIAVLDCLALADTVLLPDNDLQLAACLKSPLIGLHDDDLIDLAAEREGSLWQSLADSPRPRHRAAHRKLFDWMTLADRITPFSFFSRILGPDGGRRALLSRLGAEAGDVLDVFLFEALNYERTGPPSLHGFLGYIRDRESDVKRETDERSEHVRIMTVHGAKGLEADTVFLVDTGSAGVSAGNRDALLKFGDPVTPALLMRQPGVRASEQERKFVEKETEQAYAEYCRLLYVGMTRARDILQICGIKRDRTPDKCWYRLAADAIVPEGVGRQDGELSEPYVWPGPQEGIAAGGAQPPERRADDEDDRADHEDLQIGARPDWLARPASPPPRVPMPLRPSTALGEPEPVAGPDSLAVVGALAGGSGIFSALLRGSAIHTLLQRLPGLDDADRRELARKWLMQTFPQAAEDHAAWIAEAMAVIEHPDLRGFFGPEARAEVPLAGFVETRSGQHAVSGQIDRLVISGERVRIVDFKTDRRFPAGADHVDPAHVTQLALYRRLVGRATGLDDIRAFLVWTAGPAILELNAIDMDAALDAIGVLPAGA